MTELEAMLTAARASADQQVNHVQGTLDDLLLPEARKLIGDKGLTDAWAILAMRLTKELHDQPQFLAELLALLALRTVQGEQS